VSDGRNLNRTGDDLRVLVVSSQFPYPPRFGFATRVYQLARQLASRHDVTLLSAVAPEERAHVESLRGELDARVEVVELPHRSVPRKRLLQVSSVLSPTPYACRAAYSARFQGAIDDLCARRRFDAIQLESSLLCTFRFPREAALVLDEHNIEYEVFRRMQAGERSAARRAFNGLEHRRFRRFEQSWWRRAEGCVFTSRREEQIVRELAPQTPTAVVPNGVDIDYFRPGEKDVEPRTLVFNGLLKYRPNLDGAAYLVEEVWPLVLRSCPDARLTIVGRGDAPDLERLRRPGVSVTGEVDDIRPYLQRAAVVTVPIRLGGGTRFKVLEGLAMGKAMVSTTLGCEGIDVEDRRHLLVADTPEDFARAVVRLFDAPQEARALGRSGRALIEDAYSWEAAGAALERLYERLTGRETQSELAPAGGISA
jgi:sugar transferase (PEP-CTERM/EpsH1 system associated)